MAGRSPAHFYLIPINSVARKAVSEHHGTELVVEMEDTLEPVFYLDFRDESREQYTFGQGEGVDIRLTDARADISMSQCAFTFDPVSRAVFLWDQSERKTTRTYSTSRDISETTIDMPESGPRSVLVARDINCHIAIGRKQYYLFSISWLCDGMYDFPEKGSLQVGPKHGHKKYVQGERIGGGAFGSVFRALDVHNGRMIAVKRMHDLDGKNMEFANREIRNLSKIAKSELYNHVKCFRLTLALLLVPRSYCAAAVTLTRYVQEHILGLIGTAGFDKHTWGEIFMPLKEGSVKSLVMEITDPDIPALASQVTIHMLRALKTLERHDIIHRDIKPENILYEVRSTGYHFELGDFGLSNDRVLAKTRAGTETFMAPEVYSGSKQTTKIDIWSLFVTIVWIHDVEGFREVTAYEKVPQVHKRVRKLAERPEFRRIKEMADKDPAKRPSARSLLKNLGDDDDGLAKAMGEMTMEAATSISVDGQNFSGDEADNPEYLLYGQQVGETSAMGAQLGVIPRDTEYDDDGPVS
jgi:serine/threonine protein kinase